MARPTYSDIYGAWRGKRIRDGMLELRNDGARTVRYWALAGFEFRGLGSNNTQLASPFESSRAACRLVVPNQCFRFRPVQHALDSNLGCDIVVGLTIVIDHRLFAKSRENIE